MNDADRLVGTLENELQTLILEWERFFSGDRRTPPEQERTVLARRIRQLVEHPTLRGAARFRLEQLQHRFATYTALWERQLRNREEGRPPVPAGRPETRQAGSSSNAASPASVERADAPRDLYERWVAAKTSLGQSPGLSREQFEARLAAQRRQIEQRLGTAVEFDVAVRDGKVRLAARPKRSERSG